MREQAQVAQAGEQDFVVQPAVVQQADGIAVEQVAGQRGDAQLWSVVGVLEQLEGVPQAGPCVLIVAVGEVAVLGQPPQPADAVVVVVDVAVAAVGSGAEDQVAFLDHHQEQQPIDQPQLPLVEGLARGLAGADGLAQGVVVGMVEETVGQRRDGLLDG